MCENNLYINKFIATYKWLTIKTLSACCHKLDIYFLNRAWFLESWAGLKFNFFKFQAWILFFKIKLDFQSLFLQQLYILMVGWKLTLI
jgi:hypothetical protein